MLGPDEEGTGKAVGHLDVEGAPVHKKTLTELEVYDDDGHIKRTGNYWKTSSHIITAVIGSGVLSLAWSVATMGWIGGVLALTFFPLVTLYCSNMLIDCYRWPTKDGERRNYKYIDAVAAYLPQWQVYLCGIAQYVNLIGTSIGYTITAAISLVAIDRGTCFHFKGHDSPCGVSVNNMIVLFGILQGQRCPGVEQRDKSKVVRRLPNVVTWLLSVLASIMSYFYSTVILVLSIVNAALPHEDYGSLGGTALGDGVTAATKTYGVFQGLGNIAFAYSFSNILIEITDTVGGAPNEWRMMKKATLTSLCVTTGYYVSVALAGYAAFGNKAPGNMLTGFAFYEPYWLLNMANAAVFVHILGAYQVWTLPWYQFFEGWVQERTPNSGIGAWVHWEKRVRVPFTDSVFHISPFRLVWRTIYVILTTIIAMLLPFFNDVLGFLGAIGFWPLTIYFPIAMHKVQHKVARWSSYWWWLMLIDGTCLIISILAAIGSVEGIIVDSEGSKPFVFSYK